MKKISYKTMLLCAGFFCAGVITNNLIFKDCETKFQLEQARKVINLQNSLIDKAIDHDEDYHKCDCPWLDGNEPSDIIKLMPLVDGDYIRVK